MRVLFTAGGTEEPIDGVRRISNASTGRTGLALAGFFAARGADVTLLHAERVDASALGVETATFVGFADLAALLERRLRGEDWDAVVHLAAVSDYSVARVTVDGRDFPPGGPGKIGTGREVTVVLRPNPKLLDSLRGWSRNEAVAVVGFKLTDTPDAASREAQAAALLARGGADYVVHNDLREIAGDRHPAAIWGPDGLVARTETKDGMAGALWDLLAGGKR